jgi:hypothetical protein
VGRRGSIIAEVLEPKAAPGKKQVIRFRRHSPEAVQKQVTDLPITPRNHLEGVCQPIRSVLGPDLVSRPA